MKINTLIIAPDNMIRQGLQELFASDRQIATSVSEPIPEQVLGLIESLHTNIAVFPVNFFDRAVIELIGAIKETFPDLKILLLMYTYEENYIKVGTEKGVEGFLLVDTETDTRRLLEYIRDLYNGQYILAGKIAKFIMNQYRPMVENEKQMLRESLLKHQILLSWRELDIVYLLMKNHKNKEMAVSLGLTEKTIRDYISHAYKKIGINRRKDAVAFLQEIMEKSDRTF